MSVVWNMLAAVYCITSRYQPLRHRTGVFRVGNPTRQSPVFVSGNYHFTVRQLFRSLRGADGYLLVADSAGINVWCAAGAGDFSEHKIADAVNAYDLKSLVDHRYLILPQLAAIGVDRGNLLKECGFNVRWGPASYLDLPEYVSAGLRCSDRMRHVSFSFGNRLRMAAGILSAYLFFATMPYVLVCLILGAWGGWIVAGVAGIMAVQCFAAAFSDKMLFKWPTTNIFLIAVALACGIGALWLAGVIGPLAAWLLIGGVAAMAALLCVDYIGSTVEYKSTVSHWLRTFDLRSLFQPEVTDRCTGCGWCMEVCPKGVLEVRDERAAVNLAADCCECLSCVKQCPSDAIRNHNPGPIKGDIKTIPDIERILKS